MCICSYFILNIEYKNTHFVKIILISFLISVKIGGQLGRINIKMLIYTKNIHIY